MTRAAIAAVQRNAVTPHALERARASLAGDLEHRVRGRPRRRPCTTLDLGGDEVDVARVRIVRRQPERPGIVEMPSGRRRGGPVSSSMTRLVRSDVGQHAIALGAVREGLAAPPRPREEPRIAPPRGRTSRRAIPASATSCDGRLDRPPGLEVPAAREARRLFDDLRRRRPRTPPRSRPRTARRARARRQIRRGRWRRPAAYSSNASLRLDSSLARSAPARAAR